MTPIADPQLAPAQVASIKARDLIIEPCPLTAIRAFIEQYHYSHSINGVKVAQCFKVTHQGVLVGAALFGAMSTTAWRKFATQERAVLELRRLVLLDHAGRNSESRVIGYCLRHIRHAMPDVEVVVSYADPLHQHDGTIYRAANFTYLGLSGKDRGFLDPETGKHYHSRALRTKYKGAYKPFVARLRAKLLAGALEPIELPGKHCFIYRIRPQARQP